MKELLDSRIISDLNETVFMSNENTLLITITIGLVLFLGCIFLFSNNSTQKGACLGLIILFVPMSFIIMGRNNFMKKAIENGEWVVLTDKVQKVMELTDGDGEKSYYMVLEKMGRVELDDLEDANQYYVDDEVYIIVVMKNGEYKSTGVTYSTKDYYYVGEH